jgi:glycosyltransferase involved in cell wall biosynthesis
MLTVALPLGHTHGWGICGKYLTRELAKLVPVRLLTHDFDAETIGDELEYSVLQGLRLDRDAVELWRDEVAEGPVLQTATDHNLVPMLPDVRGRLNVGYTFFERSVLSGRALDNARRHFDRVVAGSTWCRDVLRRHGLADVSAIFQGVDPSLFNDCENRKQFFEDQFVVFSGGKFEFRKAQDLVIRAFRVLQQRHDDVLLINAWFNHWQESWRTMSVSSYIEYVAPQADHCATVNELLVRNGIDLNRVITLPARPHASMARIYKNTDCGLFPNRCEGGTNLALMEYLACGKPAIVSACSGHCDVANDANALMLKALRPITLRADGEVVAVWDEPMLEEIVEALESAYRQRDELRRIGEAAARSMRELSWAAAARRFHDLLCA